jgi:hypothetical protein
MIWKRRGGAGNFVLMLLMKYDSPYRIPKKKVFALHYIS